MAPAIYWAFANEFTVEWNRLQAEASGDQAAKQSELDRVRNQLECLVDAIATGTPIGALQSRMVTPEARRLTLEADLAQAITPAPRLHPDLPEVYRARIEHLATMLETEDAENARALVRNLVHGDLASILSAAGAGSPTKPKTPRPRAVGSVRTRGEG